MSLACAPLADQPANDARERAVNHLTIMPFLDERARIVLEIAAHQRADAFDFMLGMGAGLPSNDTMLTTPVHFRIASASAVSNFAKQ
jgi:hypothetical protein